MGIETKHFMILPGLFERAGWAPKRQVTGDTDVKPWDVGVARGNMFSNKPVCCDFRGSNGLFLPESVLYWGILRLPLFGLVGHSFIVNFLHRLLVHGCFGDISTMAASRAGLEPSAERRLRWQNGFVGRDGNVQLAPGFLDILDVA